MNALLRLTRLRTRRSIFEVMCSRLCIATRQDRAPERDTLEYFGERFRLLHVRERVGCTFEQYLADPAAWESFMRANTWGAA